MEAAIVGFFLVGAGSVVFGASRLSAPAGWMVFGAFCLFLAAWPITRRQ